MQFLQNIFNLPPIWYTFSILSVLTLFGALGTIMSKNPVHSVIYLIVTFFSISAHYILLNAQFLAAVNIIVYAGAIMVLFLLVIMFLNLKEEADEMKNNKTIVAAVVTALLMGGILILFLRRSDKQTADKLNFSSQTGMVEVLGKSLYGEYILPFELVSVLFLVAMAGAVMLAKREPGERHF
ncbi:NADH-quinone oxidoreductase subunit J [Emticicia aquatica]|uniref:NADH-quinone oxidoreductase subunit J n=1 Tax=Emticicia aquatica TaxID=1681835 RepID=A0ABM9AP72_9BACT|nr:NADH-quinone oxidoreductase subunit J [Emticicia aquatica]CAH0995582.1 NADH-quinone oxidoreductase subunit J [Emticicia aquatica]